MTKEERDRLFAQNGWSKNDVRLLLKYVEELEASRDSRTLSAVPSEEKLSLNDLDGKTLLVKFTVTKGKLKMYPEEFDLG